MNEIGKPDFDATGAVYKRIGLDWMPLWLRGRISPATLWIALCLLASGLFYVARAQVKIDSIEGLQQQHAQDHELVAKLLAEIDALATKVDRNAYEENKHFEHTDAEVDHLRDWRDRIEDVAEAPPHSRRRR